MGDADDVTTISNRVWFLIIAALLSGIGSGASGLLQEPTDDRYRGKDAREDFAKRDAEISALRKELGRHLQSAEKHIQIIIHQKAELERLEEEVHKHQSGGMHKERN